MDKTRANGQTINILAEEEAIFPALASRIEDLARECIGRDGLFTMALSGGNTPRGLYSYLAREHAESFPWNKTYLFLGDERCVSHSAGESNYKMISDTLLSKISIPSTNVFPTINQDKDPQDAAKRYEQTIKRFFKDTDNDGQSNVNFSLCLMGLGPDGHTASLFPGTEAVLEKEKLCVANYVENASISNYRLTLTRPVFAKARKLFFLVAGEAKAEIFAQVINEPERAYPSQLVVADCLPGVVEWFVDRACVRYL